MSIEEVVEHRTPPPMPVPFPRISVIVPVYNVLPYLDRCLDSLLAQTFRDFEVILVDDGSTDGCGVRCEEWAPRLPGGRVVHQRNGGLANARNAGVAVAAAEWVAFVDSDDYVFPEYLEHLLDLAETNGVALASCGYLRTAGPSPEDEDDGRECHVSQNLAESFLWLQQEKLPVMMWGKLFRRDLLLAVPQPDGRLHEDFAIIAQIVHRAGRVAVGTKKLYVYCDNPRSIIHSSDPKRLRDLLWAIRERALFYRSLGESALERMAWAQFADAFWADLRSDALPLAEMRPLWDSSGVRSATLLAFKCRAFLLFPRLCRIGRRMTGAVRRLFCHPPASLPP